ncbi:MAG: peptidoglycan DD-metalloendopeptidase family protein [Candidatus Zixiibacteriota bacterium]
MKPILTTFLLLLLLPAYGIAQSEDAGKKLKESREQLDDYKDQVNTTKKKIDSLTNVETNLQKAITDYNDNVTRNKAVIDKLTRDLQSVRGEVSTHQQRLIETEDRLMMMRQNYGMLLFDYYRRRQQHDFTGWDYESVLKKSRMSKYLQALSGSSTREIAKADDSVKLLAVTMDSLSQAGSKITNLRNQKKAKIAIDQTLREKEEKRLGSIQRETSYLRDRLVSLSEIAREMESIIANLEESQARRRILRKPGERYLSGAFDALMGKMLPPIKGKVVSTFGWKVHPTTKLKSFSPGIDIQPAKNQKNVTASATGRVIYVGSLRGYDHFVIVEHDDGYYTMYAGLSEVKVILDDIVSSGSLLGTAGAGNIRFELRKGREHLDPVIWLDINEI